MTPAAGISRLRVATLGGGLAAGALLPTEVSADGPAGFAAKLPMPMHLLTAAGLGALALGSRGAARLAAWRGQPYVADDLRALTAFPLLAAGGMGAAAAVRGPVMAYHDWTGADYEASLIGKLSGEVDTLRGQAQQLEQEAKAAQQQLEAARKEHEAAPPETVPARDVQAADAAAALVAAARPATPAGPQPLDLVGMSYLEAAEVLASTYGDSGGLENGRGVRHQGTVTWSIESLVDAARDIVIDEDGDGENDNVEWPDYAEEASVAEMATVLEERLDGIGRVTGVIEPDEFAALNDSPLGEKSVARD